MEVPGHIVCDVCGQPKGETNRWLIAVTVPPTPDQPGEPGIAFGPMDSAVTPGYAIAHLCGHGCAMKRFSQWLEDTLK